MTARTLTIRGEAYPLVLPNLRDPRLHVAAVIISIHVLGQVVLGFRVSVPQILAAILTCWILEVAITFRQARAFVWPASAMLTGSGVALILRVVGTPEHDPWSFHAWYVFAAVAGLSLLTKYVIRYRGTHVFNPSNIGLVVAFLLLGPSRVEPLDFWWAPPLEPPMILAYAIILVGGLLVTRRLALLGLAASFWITLAIGLGILAASGHCMTANWAFSPVCGLDFWRVVVTSPEVLIFLFFMITDPKTVPTGQVGRLVFGVLVGVTSTLLIAPQTDEWGAKVGLLSGLVVVCMAKPIVDRLVPEPRSAADRIGAYLRRLVGVGSRSFAPRVLVSAVLVAAVVGGVVLAGTPARGIALANMDEVLNDVPTSIDPGTLPPITVDAGVRDYDHELAGGEMDGVLATLARNLEIENQALLQRDPALLEAVDHGDRLVEMQERLAEAEVSGETVLTHYDFDAIEVSLIVPFGAQTGMSLGLSGTGTMTVETRDADGNVVSRTDEPFELTFAMRRALGDRWMNVGVLPPQG
ncbi:MAG TPA: RnfABCDGE type electron transport complex subunit D [Candidatus Limnocylindria bacterium]|nr:RnfABCDGE type electron transport complex subunit D [Candidatus Limnocylindria bacterium]